VNEQETTMAMDEHALRELPREIEHASPLAMLAADHERFALLAEEFQAALESGRGDTRELIDRLCRELEVHSAIEEEILYPAAAQVPELAILVDEALADHARVREVIDDIREAQGDDEQLAGLVLQLAEDVEQHVSEEEHVLFPQLERRLATHLDELGRRMYRMRARLMQP